MFLCETTQKQACNSCRGLGCACHAAQLVHLIGRASDLISSESSQFAEIPTQPVSIDTGHTAKLACTHNHYQLLLLNNSRTTLSDNGPPTASIAHLVAQQLQPPCQQAFEPPQGSVTSMAGAALPTKGVRYHMVSGLILIWSLIMSGSNRRSRSSSDVGMAVSRPDWHWWSSCNPCKYRDPLQDVW